MTDGQLKAAYARAREILGFKPETDLPASWCVAIDRVARHLVQVSNTASEVDAYFEMTRLGSRHPTREANKAHILQPETGG